jgi:hypothetical protein
MSGRGPSPLVLVVPLVAAILLTLFAWPAARLEPRNLPVGIVSTAGDARLAQRLNTPAGAFEVHRYGDKAAARHAIRDREIYGAFIPAPGAHGELTVLTAPAASAAVADLLPRAAGGREARADVEEVVRGPAADERGTALAASVLPMAIAGVITGAAAALMAPAGWRRASFVVVGAVLAGLAATGIVDGWLGIVGGDWTVTWGVLSAAILAVGSVVAGLEALLGRPGVGVGAALVVVVGNASSAAGSAPELLPQPIGAIGQLLPPGASASLLRSTAFFDGAAAGGHLAVLGAWTLAGAATLLGVALHARLVDGVRGAFGGPLAAGGAR